MNYQKWRKLQEEEEKYELYQRVYVGELSEEEETDTESDCTGCSYFAWETRTLINFKI